MTVNLETSKIEQALGITASQIATQLDNGVTFYGVNADGSLYSGSTANAPGHWFDASGNVVSYSDNAIVYSEFDAQTMKVNVDVQIKFLQVQNIRSVKRCLWD